jgi:hypothetical protein
VETEHSISCDLSRDLSFILCLDLLRHRQLLLANGTNKTILEQITEITVTHINFYLKLYV